MKYCIHLIVAVAFLMTGMVCFGDCHAMPSTQAAVAIKTADAMPPCHGNMNQEPAAKKAKDDCGSIMFKADCTGNDFSIAKTQDMQQPVLAMVPVSYPSHLTLAMVQMPIRTVLPRPPPDHLARQLHRPLPHITTQRLLI